MTRIWFVRHGPTHAKAMIGWTNLAADLSDTHAISRLRAYLPSVPIISSDLDRAVQTATALNPMLRLPHDAGLREINFGIWENKTFVQAQETHPDLIRQYWETPGDIAPPDGETWHQTSARVTQAVDRIIALGHNDIIVVAHFGAILTQLQRALRCSSYEAFGHKIDNLSVTQIDYDHAITAGRINYLA